MTQTGTFDGLAENYDSARPRYPVDVFIDRVRALAAIHATDQIVKMPYVTEAFVGLTS